MHARTQVMEKRHIRRENKVKQVLTEKHVLSRVAHEFVVKLWFTFQVRFVFAFLWGGVAAVPFNNSIAD